MSYAIYAQYDVLMLAWLFFIQNVFIGFFHVIRIIKLKNYSRDSMKIDGQVVRLRNTAHIETAIILGLLFGFVHVLFFIFLLFLSTSLEIEFLWLFISGLMFFGTHAFNLKKSIESDNVRLQSLTKQFIFPFVRVLPMQVMIIVGVFFVSFLGLVLIGVVKLIADIVMHQVEHNVELVEFKDYVSEKEIRKKF